MWSRLTFPPLQRSSLPPSSSPAFISPSEMTGPARPATFLRSDGAKLIIASSNFPLAAPSLKISRTLPRRLVGLGSRAAVQHEKSCITWFLSGLFTKCGLKVQGCKDLKSLSTVPGEHDSARLSKSMFVHFFCLFVCFARLDSRILLKADLKNE